MAGLGHARRSPAAGVTADSEGSGVRRRRWRPGYAAWWLLGLVPGLRWSRIGLWLLGLGNRLVIYERRVDGRWRRM